MTNGFKAVVDIDLNGTFNACRAAYQHLVKQGGTVISITATQATVPTPLQVHAGARRPASRSSRATWRSSGAASACAS